MTTMFGAFDRPHVLVLGAGESGLAIARFAASNGARMTIADTRDDAALNERAHAALNARPDAQARIVAGASFTQDLLDGIDIVALSPGLSPYREPLQSFLTIARERGVAIWGELEFFAHALAHLNSERGYAPRVLGITGTNGKTTVTALTGFLIEQAGIKVRVAGNISPAALDALSDALANDALPDAWVLELSSFQLESMHSLMLDAAVVLNVTEDHLDWHPSFDAYAHAKARIYTNARVRIANRGDATTLKLAGEGAITIGVDEPPKPGDFGLADDIGLRWLARCDGTPASTKKRRKTEDAAHDDDDRRVTRLMPADALRIAGDHNLLNAQAALALVQAIGVPAARALYALREFQGLPHRVEFVRRIDDVDYIDDSKGTNVGATVAALGGLKRRVVLIAGGDGKGQDFAPLTAVIDAWARAVVLIGRDAERIAAVVPQHISVERAASLDEAVQLAARLAQPNDAVLLSPACASLDMFRNYAHRADVFIDAVRGLALARGEVC